MITRVRSDFIFQDPINEDFNSLLVRSNMYGYPYFRYQNDIYFVRCNNKGNKLRPVLVTENVEEV